MISSGGGAKVTIVGTNFGVSPDDVLDIKLVGYPCLKTEGSKQNQLVVFTVNSYYFANKLVIILLCLIFCS